MNNNELNNVTTENMNEAKGEMKMGNKELKNRYDFIVLFDVENGNPNGDPDTNMPRIDPETNLGLVTDVCLKRKIRNYIETVKEDCDGYKIYVKKGSCLNLNDMQACKSLNVDSVEKLKKLKSTDKDIDMKIRDYMCRNYYDIRTFGAVMTTFQKAALNCGQVKGAVQLGFANSIDPIFNQDVTLTRVAITTEKDLEKKTTEIGRKNIVPYGLYKVKGRISANIANKSGFTEDDLELLWQAIINMFENDGSAARGYMAVRELIVFKHESKLGNCSSHKLFDAISVKRKDDVLYPRKYQDYIVEIDEEKIPESVEMIRMI